MRNRQTNFFNPSYHQPVQLANMGYPSDASIQPTSARIENPPTLAPEISLSRHSLICGAKTSQSQSGESEKNLPRDHPEIRRASQIGSFRTMVSKKDLSQHLNLGMENHHSQMYLGNFPSSPNWPLTSPGFRSRPAHCLAQPSLGQGQSEQKSAKARRPRRLKEEKTSSEK